MARIRTIKPGFMESPDVVALSRGARLFFIQLLTQVDDEGRYIWSAKRVVGQLYPFDDDVTNETVEGWLSECQSVGMVSPKYAHGELCAIEVTNFRKHQVINRPQPSVVTPFPDHSQQAEKHGKTTAHDSFTDDSLNDHGAVTDQSEGEWKGREGNGYRHISRARGSQPVEKLPETRDGLVLQDATAVVDGETVMTVFEDGEDPPEGEPVEKVFLRFLEAYPESPNANRVTAWRAFHRLVFDGVKLEDVVLGAKRYAASVQAQGNSGSKYVMAPSTFLKADERHWEAPWKPPASSGSSTASRLGEAQAAARKFVSKTENNGTEK